MKSDELDVELDVYLKLLFEGSNKPGGKENAEERTQPGS